MGAEGQPLDPKEIMDRINKQADETIGKNAEAAERTQFELDKVKDEVMDSSKRISNSPGELRISADETLGQENRASSYKVLEKGAPVDELKDLRINDARIGQMKRELGSDRGENKVA